MRMRYPVLAILTLVAVAAAVGCGNRGEQGRRPPGSGTRPTTAPSGDGDSRPPLHVEPGQEPVGKGKTPFETALLRAKWQMERVQTAISGEDTATIRDSVEGAQAAIADARKAAPRKRRRDLDAIERDIERLRSLADKPTDPAAGKAARSAHKRIMALLGG